jgi:hypothetical protein
MVGIVVNLPWGLRLGLHDKLQHKTDYVTDLLKRLHPLSCQSLKVASDKVKALYDRLTCSVGLQEGNRFWLYCPTQ